MPKLSFTTTCLASLVAISISACGPDSDTATYDARPPVDATKATVDAPSQTDASVADAATTDADTTDADTADADTADADTADASGTPGEVVLNEILLDQLGDDNDEFAELRGEANTDYSALTLLQIDGDQSGGTNPGLVLTAHPGCTTNSAGYCVIVVAANSFQNGTQSLLLVSGDGPFVGQDIDADNDGVVDNQVWDTLIDAVAIFDNTPALDNTDRTYAGGAVLTKIKSGSEPAAFGGASRIPNGIDTDTATDWVSNTPAFSNVGIQSGEAHNTPGAANTVAP